MRILVANDDGIYSPGLLLLARAAARFGEVRIFAPAFEQSSMGHAITHSRPLHVRRTTIQGFEAYRVDGTPADCVAVGVDVAKPIDLVLSGVNLGLNLGNSTWHSGTLAAAKQAALLGVRGIALSAPTLPDADLATLEPWLIQVLERLTPEPSAPLVNVNFPAHPTRLVWARQSVRHYDGSVVPGEDPMGRQHFWLAIKPIEDVEEGTDRWAVRQGFVAMTPLRLDLTDVDALARMQSGPT